MKVKEESEKVCIFNSLHFRNNKKEQKLSRRVNASYYPLYKGTTVDLFFLVLQILTKKTDPSLLLSWPSSTSSNGRKNGILQLTWQLKKKNAQYKN